MALVGVPDRLPVVVLKVAQDGWPTIEKVSGWFSGSDAVGWKA